MPTTYACDQCGTTAPSLDGWQIVSVNMIYVQPGLPSPPGGRTLESTLPDYIFDTPTCRAAWCEAHGLPAPPARSVTVE